MKSSGLALNTHPVMPSDLMVRRSLRPLSVVKHRAAGRLPLASAFLTAPQRRFWPMKRSLRKTTKRMPF